MVVKLHEAKASKSAICIWHYALNNNIRFKAVSRKEKYQWIEKTLPKFRYFGLRKKDKATVKNYIRQMTGLSDARTTRIIARKKKSGSLWLDSTKKVAVEVRPQHSSFQTKEVAVEVRPQHSSFQTKLFPQRTVSLFRLSLTVC